MKCSRYCVHTSHIQISPIANLLDNISKILQNGNTKTEPSHTHCVVPTQQPSVLNIFNIHFRQSRTNEMVCRWECYLVRKKTKLCILNIFSVAVRTYIFKGHLLAQPFHSEFHRDRKRPLGHCLWIAPRRLLCTVVYRINAMNFRFKYRYGWTTKIYNIENCPKTIEQNHSFKANRMRTKIKPNEFRTFQYLFDNAK